MALCRQERAVAWQRAMHEAVSTEILPSILAVPWAAALSPTLSCLLEPGGLGQESHKSMILIAVTSLGLLMACLMLISMGAV